MSYKLNRAMSGPAITHGCRFCLRVDPLPLYRFLTSWYAIAMRGFVIFLLTLIGLVCASAFPAVASRGALTLVMFPPENQTKIPELNWIGEGLATAVSEEMESPGVETVSWSERVRFIESVDLPSSTPLSRGSMIRVAQKAAADALVFGSYSGTSERLRIVLRVLDLKTLKLGGEKVANGPLSALPQLENELAWVLLADVRPGLNLLREEFRARTRKVSNQAYTSFINSLSVTDAGERTKRLLKTFELNRDFPQAAFLVGEYYFSGNDWFRAIQYLKPALKSSQNFRDAEFMLGTSYLKVDDNTDAIQAYSTLISRTRSVEALNNLGVAYARKGDFAAAMQNLTDARTLAKSDLLVESNLALVYRLQGEDAAALAILADAVKAHPDQGMIQYLYSLTLADQGERDNAARALAQAQRLGLDPDKLKRQDPRTWTQIFPTWSYRGSSAWIGDARDEKN